MVRLGTSISPKNLTSGCPMMRPLSGLPRRRRSTPDCPACSDCTVLPLRRRSADKARWRFPALPHLSLRTGWKWRPTYRTWHPRPCREDRKSVVEGKRVHVRVDLGGSRHHQEYNTLKKKHHI